MYSELNKKTNSYRNLNFAIQPTCKKIQVSSSLRLPRDRVPLICPLQQKFSWC